MEAAPQALAKPTPWRIDVVDEHDLPLVGAAVFTRSLAPGHPVRLLGETDAQGSLDAELGLGPHWVAAKLPQSGRRTLARWIPRWRPGIDGPTPPQTRLTAWPSEGVALEVNDSSGQPISTARVWLEPIKGPWWSKWNGAGALLGEAWWTAVDGTGPGRFTLQVEALRQYRLLVEAPGYAPWISTKFDATRGRPDQVVLTPQHAEIHGQVRDQKQPASDVRVFLRDLDNNQVLAETRTSARGEYAFDGLPRAALQVVAIQGERSAFGFVSTDKSLKTRRVLNLSLEPSVRGTVRDAAGQPAAGRRVDLAAVANMGRGSHPGLELALYRTVTTGEDGRFAFGGVRPGEHRVLVYDETGEHCVLGRMGVRAGRAPLQLTAHNPSQALGQVTLRIPNKAHSEVWLSEQTLHVGTLADLGPDGRVTVEDLLPGRYEVAVLANGQPIEVGHVQIRAGESLPAAPMGAPAPCRVQLRLAPQARVDQAQADRSAYPADQLVRVRARSTRSVRTIPVVERRVRVNDLYAGLDLRLPAGEITIEVVHGEQTYEARGMATSGGRLELELTTVNTRMVRLHLAGLPNLPGSGPIRVEVFDEESGSRGVRHHPRQRQPEILIAVFQLPPGNYRAVCTRGGMVLAGAPFLVEHGENPLEIELGQH